MPALAQPLTPHTGAGKYLTFLLGNGAFGIPILKVREIIRLLDITPIPRMPDYVRGVINLRGKIVPVIDLRMKFGLPNVTTAQRSCIVVVYVTMAEATKLMGLIVDALEEVFQINAEDLEPSPDFGKGASAHYIQNMAKTKGQMKALLNIDELIQDDRAVLPMNVFPSETPPTQR
jgi:purine-binding chemotaxis protein CheW